MAVELCRVLMGNSKIPGGMHAARKQSSVALKEETLLDNCSETWRSGLYTDFVSKYCPGDGGVP